MPNNQQSNKGAAGNSRCPCQLRLIYEIVRHTFISASRSAAVPELGSLGIMGSRITIGVAGALALTLCFVSMKDVPHNIAIRSPGPTMTILWVAVALIIITGILALIRSSKMATVFSLIASGFGILFSLILACV